MLQSVFAEFKKACFSFGTYGCNYKLPVFPIGHWMPDIPIAEIFSDGAKNCVRFEVNATKLEDFAKSINGILLNKKCLDRSPLPQITSESPSGFRVIQV